MSVIDTDTGQTRSLAHKLKCSEAATILKLVDKLERIASTEPSRSEEQEESRVGSIATRVAEQKRRGGWMDG